MDRFVLRAAVALISVHRRLNEDNSQLVGGSSKTTYQYASPRRQQPIKRGQQPISRRSYEYNNLLIGSRSPSVVVVHDDSGDERLPETRGERHEGVRKQRLRDDLQLVLPDRVVHRVYPSLRSLNIYRHPRQGVRPAFLPLLPHQRFLSVSGATVVATTTGSAPVPAPPTAAAAAAAITATPSQGHVAHALCRPDLVVVAACIVTVVSVYRAALPSVCCRHRCRPCPALLLPVTSKLLCLTTAAAAAVSGTTATGGATTTAPAVSAVPVGGITTRITAAAPTMSTTISSSDAGDTSGRDKALKRVA